MPAEVLWLLLATGVSLVLLVVSLAYTTADAMTGDVIPRNGWIAVAAFGALGLMLCAAQAINLIFLSGS